MKIISQGRFEHGENFLCLIVREAVEGHQELAHEGQALTEHSDDGLGALRVRKEARWSLFQEALYEGRAYMVLLGLNLTEDTLEVLKDGYCRRHGDGIGVQGDQKTAR